MKILIVTRCFFPHGDAGSAVVFNLAEALTEKKNEIEVLALTHYPDDEKVSTWNNINIHNVYCAEVIPKEQLKQAFKKKPIKIGWILVKKIMWKIYGKLRPKYRQLSINPLLASKFKKAISTEVRRKKYDLCVITMMPHEAVWAVHELQNKGIITTPHIVLQNDTYWDQQALPVGYKEERFDFEKEVAMRSLFVMTTPQVYFSDTRKHPDMGKKMIISEFPMVKRQRYDVHSGHNADGMWHCVFLGRLYPLIRPPEKIIKVIARIKDENVVFDFYGARQDLITSSEYYSAAKGKLNLYGEVETEMAIKKRTEADALVNIDNTNLTQVPSKLFEYISTCKPIINFYFDDRSPSLDYLRRYPACLNINVNKDVDYDEISNFFMSLNKISIDFDKVKELFLKNTPEYVTNQLLEEYAERINKI